MTPLRAWLGLALLLGALPAAAQDGPAGRTRPSLGDPSAVIAADLALSREARSRGEAAALERAAAPAAVVLVPQPVPAERWLKGRNPPPPAPSWAPRIVWASCDGGYAVTLGAWHRGERSGDYLALWQRQPKGDWRWLLHEDGPAAPVAHEPELISGRVAECFGLPPRPRGFVPPPVSPMGDASRDGSLEWTVLPAERCGLAVTVRAWDGQAMADVLSWTRPAPPQGCGPPSGERG